LMQPEGSETAKTTVLMQSEGSGTSKKPFLMKMEGAGTAKKPILMLTTGVGTTRSAGFPNSAGVSISIYNALNTPFMTSTALEILGEV
ncbi:MAG: hypothetical protein Q4F52_11785, partial [Bacteroidaceae bacterium]|nr:hypothetical protein [Bacteroidaceae bacterium]